MAGQNLLSRLATTAWTRRYPEVSLSHPDRENPHLELTVLSLPRLAADHARLAIARRRDGIVGQPWITATSKTFLETMLQPTDVGLEFGSGGSTAWLARLVAFVYSVDAFEKWHRPLAEHLQQEGIENVSLFLASATELGYETEPHRAAYVGAHPELEAGSLDFVFVDGEFRDDCALRGLELLRPGGVFVLDNASAYLPSTSRSPWKVERPATDKWEKFVREVEGWRHVWTTNGAWDTAIWIRPS